MYNGFIELHEKISLRLSSEYYISFITTVFILIFRALIVRKKEGERRNVGEKATEFTAVTKYRKFHVVFNLTACSVIFASTLTTHQNDSK